VRAVRWAFVAHLAALAFGLIGLVVMVPHPSLWEWSALLARVFNFGIHHAGPTHIVLGAITLLLFGLVTLGPRKTLTFFAIATLLPLAMELIGTSTGWPFGKYAYTSGLGYKIAGKVPFSIPLSWFYGGFTAYLLATLVIRMRRPRWPVWAPVLLGAWLLTAWDLVLDPAMASPHLSIRFWLWEQSGQYVGMPLTNFAGWAATGALFMAIARLLWREDADPRRVPAWLPFGVYVANIAFAIVLSISVGLWLPPLAAIVFGVLPASLALPASPLGGGGRLRALRFRRAEPQLPLPR